MLELREDIYIYNNKPRCYILKAFSYLRSFKHALGFTSTLNAFFYALKMYRMTLAISYFSDKKKITIVIIYLPFTLLYISET